MPYIFNRHRKPDFKRRLILEKRVAAGLPKKLDITQYIYQ